METKELIKCLGKPKSAKTKKLVKMVKKKINKSKNKLTKIKENHPTDFC